jgi:O-antigen/teichoic acid export membrane protein
MMPSSDNHQSDETERISALAPQHNFMWSLVGLLVYNGCQFGLIILLTRIGGAEMVGTYVLAMALAAPFQIIGTQLASLQATDISCEFSFNNYLLLGLLSGLLIIFGAPITGWWLNYNTGTLLIVIIVAIAKAIENVSWAFLGTMQMCERMDLFSISLMIKGAVSLAVFFLLLYFSQELLWPVLGIASVGLMMLLMYDLPFGYKVGRKARVGRVNRLTLRDMIGLSRKTAPLSIGALLSSLTQTIPRLFLERYWGLRILGYFGPIAYVLNFGDLMAAALGRSMAPRLARHWLMDRQALQPAVNKLLALTGVFGLVSVLLVFAIGGRALTILFGPSYAVYNSVLIWLTVAMGFSVTSQFFSYLLTAMRLLNAQAMLALLTLITTLVLCAMLIPTFGMAGTALGICCGQFFRLGGSYFIYFKCLSRNPA